MSKKQGVITFMQATFVVLVLAWVFIGIGRELKDEPKIEATDAQVPVASLSSYASIEATRVAKMAHLMLGLGGEFVASCESVYNTKTDKVETEYRVQWKRDDMPDMGVDQLQWAGANWGECIGKMMAWRGGE
jgi:hypothetical protein